MKRRVPGNKETRFLQGYLRYSGTPRYPFEILGLGFQPLHAMRCRKVGNSDSTRVGGELIPIRETETHPAA
jgi:hypothetical protein